MSRNEFTEEEIGRRIREEFLGAPPAGVAAAHLDTLFAEQASIAASAVRSQRSAAAIILGSAAAAVIAVSALGLQITPTSNVDLVAASPHQATVTQQQTQSDRSDVANVDAAGANDFEDRTNAVGGSDETASTALATGEAPQPAGADESSSPAASERIDGNSDIPVETTLVDAIAPGETPGLATQDVDDDEVPAESVVLDRLEGLIAGGTVLAAAPLHDLSCEGHAATIVGSNGPDVIVGTDGPDVIVAGNGVDVILALAGDDIVCGGNGDDEIYGGEGDDLLVGQNGDDAIIDDLGVNVILPGRGLSADGAPSTPNGQIGKNPNKP